MGELKGYLNVEWGKATGIDSRIAIMGVLERTVDAIKAGATSEELRQLFIEYLPAYQPDRTAG